MASTFIAIQTITTSTSPNSVSFTSIPQTYKHLCVIANLSSNATDAIKLQFNSDTATNYKWGEIYMGGTATMKQYKGYPSNYSLGNSELTDNQFGALELWIPNYVSSAYKPYLYRNSCMVYNSLGSQASSWGGGQWDNTTAINSVTIAMNSGAFRNGTNITLYGLA
jgi:hypothetical protein